MDYLSAGFSSLSSALYQGARAVMPVAVDALTEMSLRDQQIGKIVGGMGLIVIGSGLFVKSAVLDNLIFRLSGQNQKVSKTALAVAATGLAIVGYGTYNLVTGTYELAGDYLLYANCNRDAVIEKGNLALQCPEVQKLWNEVKAQGDFKLHCASPELVRSAATFSEARILAFSRIDDDFPYALTFELNNLKRTEAFKSIGLNSCSLDADSFALAAETIEYGTTLDTHRIATSCIQGGFWPAHFNMNARAFDGARNWNSFEVFLEYAEKTGHIENYREQWRKSCGQPDRQA